MVPNSSYLFPAVPFRRDELIRSPEPVSSHVIFTLDIGLCTYIISLRPFPLLVLHRSIIWYILIYGLVMAPELAFKLYDRDVNPDNNVWIRRLTAFSAEHISEYASK